MATVGQPIPITRADLREELEAYATKDYVDARLSQLETRMVKWMTGVMLGGLTAVAGLTAVLLRVLA